jgi:hypothetical protein
MTNVGAIIEIFRMSEVSAETRINIMHQIDRVVCNETAGCVNLSPLVKELEKILLEVKE